MNKTYQISAKLRPELGEKIDELAKEYFAGNKTALIQRAIEEFVASYECSTTQERASPRSKEIHDLAEYISAVLLQGFDCDSLVKKEVLNLCRLIM